MTGPRLLLIVAPGIHQHEDGFRGEACDYCGVRVWLAKKGQNMIDDAKEENLDSEVACTPCAVNQYGVTFVTAVVTSQVAADRMKEN